MADITSNAGEGLDIRALQSGVDTLGVYPSGTFIVNMRVKNQPGETDISNNRLGAPIDENGNSVLLKTALHYYDGGEWNRFYGKLQSGIRVYSDLDLPITGNIDINSPETIGSYPVQNIQGSVSVSGTIITNHGESLLSTDFSAISGTSTLAVSGATGSQINVYSYKLVAGEAALFKFLDGTGDLEGQQSFAANGGAVENVNPPAYLFQGGTGSNINISTTGSVAGRASYFLT